MKNIGILIVLFFILISVGSPVQAKESFFTLQRGFASEYAARAHANTPVFANVELAEPVRRGLSAESFVSTLAHDERKDRKIGGGVLTGMGLLFIGLGAATDNNDAQGALLICGGITAGIGLYVLAVPSYIESEYERIIRIKDPREREEVSYSVLTHVANKARVERLSGAVMSGALCLYCLVAGPDYLYYNDNNHTYNALVLGAISIFSFLVESPAEKMLKEYKEGQKRSGHFAIIPRPDGSISAVYSLAF